MALTKKYDFIAITDHRFDGRGSPCGRAAGKCDDTLCKDVVEKCHKETRLLCIPSMEVTGKVHLLALGIQRGIDERLSIKVQVEQIHQQGGLAIAAHPYTSPWVYTNEELTQSGLDAMECRGGNSAGGLPCLYNSDAHSATQMYGGNACAGVLKTFEDIKVAIKTNRCTP